MATPLDIWVRGTVDTTSVGNRAVWSPPGDVRGVKAGTADMIRVVGRREESSDVSGVDPSAKDDRGFQSGIFGADPNAYGTAELTVVYDHPWSVEYFQNDPPLVLSSTVPNTLEWVPLHLTKYVGLEVTSTGVSSALEVNAYLSPGSSPLDEAGPANPGQIGTPLRYRVTEVSANYTTVESDQVVLVDASAGSVTITLVSTSEVGLYQYIKRVDANPSFSVTVLSFDSIDGTVTLTMAQPYEGVQVMYEGSTWRLL